MEYKYLEIKNKFSTNIHNGVWTSGQKLPSIRSLAKDYQVSINTVLAALERLEAEGVIEAIHRSGFYVAPEDVSSSPMRYNKRARKIDIKALFAYQATVAQQMPEQLKYSFAYAIADSTFLPPKSLMRNMQQMMTDDLQDFGHSITEDLKIQIIRSFFRGCDHSEPEHLTVCYGATEGLSLVLRTLCSKGDCIAVENPTYFDYFKIAKFLDIEIIAIPTNPEEGIDLCELEKQLKKRPIKLIVVQPTVQNPLGFIMSDQSRHQLIRLSRNYSVPILEDKTFSELQFDPNSRVELQNLAKDHQVITVSSVGKILSSRLKVGWVYSSKYAELFRRAQETSRSVESNIYQRVLLNYLSSEQYRRHIRSFRRKMQSNISLMEQRIASLFPDGTIITRPKGGYTIWVQLPSWVDVVQLYLRCLAKGVAFMPGKLFSGDSISAQCIRINAGVQMTSETDNALKILARQIKYCSKLDN